MILSFSSSECLALVDISIRGEHGGWSHVLWRIAAAVGALRGNAAAYSPSVNRRDGGRLPSYIPSEGDPTVDTLNRNPKRNIPV